MNISAILSRRIYPRDIQAVCTHCHGEAGNSHKAELYSFISHDNDKTAYNALWIFTHFTPDDKMWLYDKRDNLIDNLIRTKHIGRQRLLLTLLENRPITSEDVRTDYLDFCLEKINSNNPYAIRALCLKQAFAQCRFHPELMVELMAEIELMDYGEMSPGLKSARKNILKKISALPTFKTSLNNINN